MGKSQKTVSIIQVSLPNDEGYDALTGYEEYANDVDDTGKADDIDG